MNNFFNYHRFALLVRRQWVENRRLFLMALAILLGLGIFFYSFNINWEHGVLFNLEGRMIIFYFSFFLAGSFFTNYIFRDLSDKNSSTSFLLVPASHFEKQLSALLYVFVGFPIAFFILFTIIDYSFVSIGNGIMNDLKSKTGLLPNRMLLSYLKTDEARLGIMIPAWFCVQAFVILGSISFTGWSYIKTGFTGFATLFVIVLFVGLMQKLFLDDLSNELGGTHYFQIKPTRDMLNGYVMFGLKYALTPLFMVIAYFKLKEKQV